MSKSNKKLFILLSVITLIIILILGAFYSGYLSLNFPSKENAKAPQQQAMAQPVIDVNVVKIELEEIQLTQTLPGRINAFRIAEVRPQADGIIEKIKFEEGSFVKEKSQLYQLDSESQKANYEKAKTNLTAVKNKADRYEVLLQIDAVSKQEYDDVLTNLAQAKAELKAAEEDLQYTKVIAPISGHIGKTNFTEGALVTANQQNPLTTIAQLSPIYVDLTQPSKEAIKFGDQTDISVTIDFDGTQFEEIGTLQFSEVFADQSTDSVVLRSKFLNKNKKLIPGMFVNATLHLKPFTALTVPQRAATRTPDGNLMVWVLTSGNIAKPRVITAYKPFKDKWIVESGLQENEFVVYEGFMKLKDGAKINPIMMEESIAENTKITSQKEGSKNDNLIIVEKRNSLESKAIEQKMPTQRLAKALEVPSQQSNTKPAAK